MSVLMMTNEKEQDEEVCMMTSIYYHNHFASPFSFLFKFIFTHEGSRTIDTNYQLLITNYKWKLAKHSGSGNILRHNVNGLLVTFILKNTFFLISDWLIQHSIFP